jgi:hypothetical protein
VLFLRDGCGYGGQACALIVSRGTPGMLLAHRKGVSIGAARGRVRGRVVEMVKLGMSFGGVRERGSRARKKPALARGGDYASKTRIQTNATLPHLCHG